MTPEQIDPRLPVEPKPPLPWWANLCIYLLERIGLPTIILGFAGYYGVQHLERVGRHLERNDQSQEALVKEIASSREESKAIRATLEAQKVVLERVADKLMK